MNHITNKLKTLTSITFQLLFFNTGPVSEAFIYFMFCLDDRNKLVANKCIVKNLHETFLFYVIRDSR